MKKYKASGMRFSRGWWDIEFASRAKTKRGLLRALGKAIARQVGDDAISVNALFLMPGKQSFFHRRIPISVTEEQYMHQITHDELFEVMYA